MSKYGFVGHFGRRCSVGLVFSYGPKWQGSEQIVAVVDAKKRGVSSELWPFYLLSARRLCASTI